MSPAASSSERQAILLLSCPDRQGIVAAVTDFISLHHGNILHLDQHVDAETNVFFMRLQWELDRFDLGDTELHAQLQTVASRFTPDWSLHFTDRRPRVAIFVSKLSHVLYDILARHRSGELEIDIVLVASNHEDLRYVAEQFSLPFHLFPVTPAAREDQEQRLLDLLESERVDFIILARYMQILSPAFVARYPNRIINIHHSFLPAFAGARPYHAAYERGVKIVGATSHYVTAELDAGPIIAQDTIPVSHKDAISDLVRKGRDLEKTVLARAVWWHSRHKILVYRNKTVIFD